jgi:serine/threonine protein kinase
MNGSVLSLTPGTLFGGDYQVIRPLASGGMGAVYVAKQLSTARERALKIMLGELASNEDLKRRFEQEAKIGAEIDSEHVVEVVGAGIDAASGTPWLAMELLAGADLATYVGKRGPLSPAALHQVFEQLVHAVGAAHKKQIIHRDLKPENVFLAESKRADTAFTVKVLDFGIAKLLGQARTSSTAAMGTPLWMAPEQTQRASSVTPAADVWALGLIAFWALVGKSYWLSAIDAQSSPMMVLREVVIDPLVAASVRARELGAGPLPDGFDAWFARCVDRTSSARFPDVGAMFAELAPLLASG